MNSISSTTTITSTVTAAGTGGRGAAALARGFLRQRSALDWLFAAFVAAGGLYALLRYRAYMDGYEQAILLGAQAAAVWLGWFWRPLRALMLAAALLALLAIALYQHDGGASLARAETVFGLKYLLSSQSAILWMSLLFFISTAFYWFAMFARGEGRALALIGSRIAWAAVTMALAGSLVRWYESYLVGADIGHIPVSNLYEVFVLFCWLTATFYLYYEAQYRTRALGGFVLLVVSAAVGFLLWYTVAREAQEIQPLVPALKSWWMKLHVPANFVGYGSFALSAMVAFAYLVKQRAGAIGWYQLAPLWLLGVLLCAAPLLLRQRAPEPDSGNYWLVYCGISALAVAGILCARRRIAQRLPALQVLDDMMYKSIAVGFAFFTIATVLGALWAADAWGGYWSWDPKETWALIVWLNYAAWLHMRLIAGLRGTLSAWWALVGLAVTSFAFLGVNMFLSGLHSYGTL